MISSLLLDQFKELCEGLMEPFLQHFSANVVKNGIPITEGKENNGTQGYKANNVPNKFHPVSKPMGSIYTRQFLVHVQ